MLCPACSLPYQPGVAACCCLLAGLRGLVPLVSLRLALQTPPQDNAHGGAPSAVPTTTHCSPLTVFLSPPFYPPQTSPRRSASYPPPSPTQRVRPSGRCWLDSGALSPGCMCSARPGSRVSLALRPQPRPAAAPVGHNRRRRHHPEPRPVHQRCAVPGCGPGHAPPAPQPAAPGAALLPVSETLI